MSRIVHFEVPADNPERAQKFYAQALGWEFTQFGGPMAYWLVKTGPNGEAGIDGGMMKREKAGQGPILVAGVASIDPAIARITQAGGTPALPKMAIPGVGWAAYFVDTEGNVFGVFQSDENAK